ncbi:Lrp/AsnC family transcriptional regulator [Chitinophagaceae bacterium MMS25-I14]
MEQLDKTDKRILEVLQQEARLNTKEVAAKIGLSVTPTYERLKKIEQSGIITGFAAILDRHKIGKDLAIFCNVSLQLHNRTHIEQFEKAVNQLDEVMECYHVAGNYDYLLKVVVSDMNSYQQFLTNKLARINNIAQVHSSFVMTEIKHRTAYTID